MSFTNLFMFVVACYLGAWEILGKVPKILRIVLIVFLAPLILMFGVFGYILAEIFRGMKH
jgi:hypothetical protein